MTLIYSNKVTSNRSEFINKVIAGCNQLGINPNWLMFVMNFESGLSSTIVNKISGAVGLIQFMPLTARSLGTNVEALKLMSNVEQLDYVFKYLRTYQNKINHFIDLYLAVFFPLAINKSPEFVMETKNLSRSMIAKQNPSFDLNKDGKITVSEVEQFFYNKVPVAYQDIFKKKS